MACDHEDFEAHVSVGRITEDEGGDDVFQFTAEVTVKCIGCGARFGFRGVPPGLSPNWPTRSPDALELRAPLLSPSELELKGPLPGLSEDEPIHGMGFDINVKGPEEP